LIGNNINYTISLKHVDPIPEKPLPQKWIDHGYSTLGGIFALRALPHWEVTTTLEAGYVGLKIQGDGTKDDALDMVKKVLVEQNGTISGLSLVLHDPRE